MLGPARSEKWLEQRILEDAAVEDVFEAMEHVRATCEFVGGMTFCSIVPGDHLSAQQRAALKCELSPRAGVVGYQRLHLPIRRGFRD